ncbi:hypothetical protein OS21_46250 [Dickeya oryzae]
MFTLPPPISTPPQFTVSPVRAAGLPSTKNTGGTATDITTMGMGSKRVTLPSQWQTIHFNG